MKMKALLVILIYIAIQTALASNIQILKIIGSPNLIKNGKTTKLTKKSKLNHGDIIRTNKKDFVSFNTNKTKMSLAPNSYYKIEKSKKISSSESTMGNLLYGHLYAHFKKGHKGKRKVKTPNAVMGVRGTIILVHVTRDRNEYRERVDGKIHPIPSLKDLIKIQESKDFYSQICCIEGKIDVTTKANKKTILNKGDIMDFKASGNRYLQKNYEPRSIQKTAEKLGLLD